MDVNAVTAAATITARALYSLAGGDSTSDIPVANTSLVEELAECLTVSWSCDLVASYASSEISAIGDGLGEPLSGTDLDFGSSPPSYYPSVIYPSGLPLVVHGGSLYGKYGGTWNVGDDKVGVEGGGRVVIGGG